MRDFTAGGLMSSVVVLVTHPNISGVITAGVMLAFIALVWACVWFYRKTG